MTRAWPLLLLVIFLPAIVLSDSSDLEGGVFIAHHPPGLQYTSGQDWCARYFQEFAIDSCAEQNNRIDLDGNQGQSSVWFVLAAWEEEKEWCGVEFGFSNYEPAIYEFAVWGPCAPTGALEIPTSGWPGPSEGVSVTVQGASWWGRIVPVYWLAGYAYDEGEVPLSYHPSTGFGGAANCLVPPTSWPATSFGGMGIFHPGTYACPGGSSGPPPPSVCCVGQVCYVLSAEDCEGLGGVHHPEWEHCQPNPCTITPSGTQTWGQVKSCFRPGVAW